MNLLGQNDEVLLKELGHCVGSPENDYHEIKGLTAYRYDRMGAATYDGKICAIVVAGHKLFGRTWNIEDNGINYNEIEKYFNDDFEAKTEEVKYYDRTMDLEFIKYEYGDYILYFDLFENKIGYMVVTLKADDGLLDDTAFVLLDEICL